MEWEMNCDLDGRTCFARLSQHLEVARLILHEPGPGWREELAAIQADLGWDVLHLARAHMRSGKEIMAWIPEDMLREEREAQ